jgi:hypothetical protein
VGIVAKVLGHRQGGVTDAEAGAGRLVHLPKDEDRILQDAGLLDVTVELLALARTLADAAENAHALVIGDHIVDHLHEENGLANAGAAEEARLAAALDRRQQVDGLNTGLIDLGRRGAFRQGHAQGAYGAKLANLDRALAVDRLAKDVKHTAEQRVAHRHLEPLPGIDGAVAAGQALAEGEGNAAHGGIVEVGEHLHEHRLVRAGAQEIIEARQPAGERGVDDVALNGNDAPNVVCTWLRTAPVRMGHIFWKARARAGSRRSRGDSPGNVPARVAVGMS